MQYYKHHVGDFIKDTSNLDDHQSMTYLRMLWKYYLDEAPLSGSFEDIAFTVRSDEKTVRTLLKHFFISRDDAWIHIRCEREIKGFYDKSEKARASAKSRWDANTMQTQCERIANASKIDANAPKSDADCMLPITHNPLPIIKTKTTTAKMPTPDGVSPELWSDYLSVRKGKPMTQTALNGIAREATKAGISLEAGLRVCAERGWSGLKAEWLDDKKLTVHQQQMQAFARGIGLGRSEPAPFYQHETLQTVNDIPQLEDHDHEQF